MKFLIPFLILLAGCAGTSAAYKAADTLEEQAFVVTEHYAAIVKEAADIATAPGAPQSVKESLKQADSTAKPLVLAVAPLAQAYTKTKTAADQVALQAALNEAVVALSNFITTVKESRK